EPQLRGPHCERGERGPDLEVIDVRKAARPHVVGEPDRVPPGFLARERTLDQGGEIDADLGKEEPALDRIAHPHLLPRRAAGANYSTRATRTRNAVHSARRQRSAT